MAILAGPSLSAPNPLFFLFFLSPACSLPSILQRTLLTLEFICGGLSWLRVCYNTLYERATMPAVDYSEITDTPEAELGVWTSCRVELKVVCRTRLVVTRDDDGGDVRSFTKHVKTFGTETYLINLKCVFSHHIRELRDTLLLFIVSSAENS